jgi:hypothetical protein
MKHLWDKDPIRPHKPEIYNFVPLVSKMLQFLPNPWKLENISTKMSLKVFSTLLTYLINDHYDPTLIPKPLYPE